MCIPIVFLGQCLLYAIVEVFVVGEDDMTADIIELWHISWDFARAQLGRYKLTKPSGVISVDARPPGVSLESTIIQDGPSCGLGECCGDVAAEFMPYYLVQALCCTQSSGASTNDQDINRTELD